jgi:Protein of unknown function (DUF3085)
MGQCVFKTEKLFRPFLHALQAPNWSVGYQSDETPAPGFLFVHDDGIYMMSNGIPGDTEGAQTRQHVVYAAGCDPQNDPDFYDTARDLVGGDDFAEYIAFERPEEFARLLTHFEEMVIDITSTSFTVVFQCPRERPSTIDLPTELTNDC